MEGRPDLFRRAAAEGVGVFALVFAGCGAVIAEAEHPGALGTVGVALVFGLIVMAMVYATGHLSGAHLNPAVTLAFVATRHFPRAEAAAYIAAQLAGALAAAGLLAAIWPGRPAALGATIPTVGLAALSGGPITGASMNPARSIGPALASGELHDLWLYIAAPLAGAVLGALVYQLVRGELPAEPQGGAA